MNIILIIFIALIVISLIIAIYEFNRAELVPPDQPFLHGDYDPKNDPFLKHKAKFCEKCEEYDGQGTCLIHEIFGKLTDEKVHRCLSEGYFKPKVD